MYESDRLWNYVRLSREIGPTVGQVIRKKLRIKKAVILILPHLWVNRRMRIFVLEALSRLSGGTATLEETLARLSRCCRHDV